MSPTDFFKQEQDPWSDESDPFAVHEVFDVDLVIRFRQGTVEGFADLDAAYKLAQLAHTELEAFGTSGGQKLDDEEMVTLLRSLKAVLRRLKVEFDPPFRDFKGFHGYWSAHGMSGVGGWGARRGYLNELFSPLFTALDNLEEVGLGATSVRGVDGEIKNIIFASTGPKPRIVFRDALNNVIEVVENAEYCLFYNRPLTEEGLTWGGLVDWWKAEKNLGSPLDSEIKRQLYKRLLASLGNNEAEKLLFGTYYRRFKGRDAAKQPALLPQVYLHYDPMTRRERGGRLSSLVRERMDFLLLLPGGVRIVLEVDGQQHYAEGDRASPRLYSEMVAEDRALRLKGYDVYRFGGSELGRADAPTILSKFFNGLEARYGGWPIPDQV